MAEPQESHFTILVRLPFNRGDFVDPPPVSWSSAKERKLWQIISRPGDGNDIDWNALADGFEVTQPFLLQQAAWLYERQLSQVRAQMRKVGTTVLSSSTSPAPGSMSGSTVGGYAMKRGGSGGSRVPSRLSIRQTKERDSPTLRSDPSAPGTPIRSKAHAGRQPSLSNIPASQSRRASLEEVPKRHSQPPSKPASKESLTGKSSLRAEPRPKPDAVASAIDENDSSDSDSSSHAEAPGQVGHRISYRRRRTSRHQSTMKPAKSGEHDPSDSDDSPAFLPFATTASRATASVNQPLTESPSATLRGAIDEPAARPQSHRRGTMERVPQVQANSPAVHDRPRLLSRPDSNIPATSTSSMSESFTSSGAPRSESPSQSQTSPAPNPLRGPAAIRPPGPLSPRRAAELAAAGLSPSPRRRGHPHSVAQREGHTSDGTGTPSMGSSFSDLDDTSLTQSALEEALLSNMQHAQQGNGNIASRMSNISQALRSRYL